MVKYYLLNDENDFLYSLYKLKPNHPFLELREKKDWCDTSIFMSHNDFVKCNFGEKLNFKGIIKYPEYCTTANGVLLNEDKTHFIHLNIDEACNFAADSYNIYEQFFKKLKITIFDNDFDLDYIFFHENKKFPDFTDEEWNEFVQDMISKDIFKLTDDV
jgi:hypothetical protein